MDWSDIAIDAALSRDSRTLYDALEVLELNRSIGYILPYVIGSSGYRVHQYIPLYQDKDMLDIAGYILDKEDDSESLAMDAISDDDIDTLSFILRRGTNGIDLYDLLDYSIELNRKNIEDFLLDEYIDIFSE